MKKLLTLSLALLLGACSSTPSPQKQSPYELYKTAYDRMNEETKLEVVMDSTIKMAFSDEEMEIAMSMHMQIDQSDDTNPMLALTITGEEVDMSAYYTDGIFYMDMMDEKMSMEMPFDEAMSSVNTVGSENQEYSEADFEGATLSEVNGNHVISFQLSDEKIDELVDQVMSEAGLSELEGVEMQAGESTISITISSAGDLLSTSVQLPFSFTIEDESFTMDTTMSLQYVAFGEDVVIELPDFSEYQQINF